VLGPAQLAQNQAVVIGCGQPIDWFLFCSDVANAPQSIAKPMRDTVGSIDERANSYLDKRGIRHVSFRDEAEVKPVVQGV
jgi:hypothetical protein